jgi:two-component system nitrate/nitrite response regulator NarL
MQTFTAHTLEVALLGADPLARTGLASALTLEAVPVAEAYAPGNSVRAVIWDDGPTGDQAPPGPTALDALPDPSAPPWIALTTTGPRARDLLQRGFRAALRRDTPPHAIAAAVDAVSRGLVVTDPDFVGSLATPRDPTLHLSPREQEVLVLLAEGLSNKEIAAELKLSPHTAKFHVTALLDKLGAQTRTEAVVRAARAGLLSF